MSNGGLFNISEDHSESSQSLDDRFIRNKTSTFFFTMSGDSMSPMIMDKDILVIDRSIPPQHNKIVIATLSGEMLCRRLHETGSGAIFIPDNPRYKKIQVTDQMSMSIFGVVLSICRDIN